MWDNVIDFFSFQDINVLYVSLGTIILGASAAIVGAFTFFRKRALVGDAVAHSVLPGVCMAFLLSGTKNYLLLIIGAFVSGWISLLFVDKIVKKSKIKEDTAIGLILSVFFGLGILLLTYIQQSGNAAQTGLDSFLFGKAASMIGRDVLVFSIISLVLIIMVVAFFKELFLISFDENFAQAIGLPVKAIEFLLTSLTVLAVVTGIQAVGVVLMAALLITPAAAARFWSGRLIGILVLAAFIGSFSGLAGTFISYLAPNMPTGPWVVMVLSAIALVSIFFSPSKGIMARLLKQNRNKRKIEEENVLKAFFQLNEAKERLDIPLSAKDIQEKRFYTIGQIGSVMARLKRQGYLKKSGNTYYLTVEGKRKSMRLVKLHRLWELYLTKYLRIAPDHVHEDADTIEHLITPELEQKLEKLLGYPVVDPHNSEIPYETNYQQQ